MPLVCYEVIFSEKINDKLKKYRIKLRDEGILEKDIMIVNLTNDIWLKHSIGLHQHFLMSRFSAVRTGVPLVRLSNNGISAIVDKHGRILYQTHSDQRAIMKYSFKK